MNHNRVTLYGGYGGYGGGYSGYSGCCDTLSLGRFQGCWETDGWVPSQRGHFNLSQPH